MVTGTSSVTVRGTVMMLPKVAEASIALGTVVGVQLAAVPQLPLALRFQVCAAAGAAQPTPTTVSATTHLRFAQDRRRPRGRDQ